MDTITLKFGSLTKPVLADRDGESDMTNWVNGGTHTLFPREAHAYTGTKSFEITASATGDFTTNNVSLASGNNATFVVGQKYCVGIWVYPSDSDPYNGTTLKSTKFQIKTGGVVSPVFESVYQAWTYFSFVFTAVSDVTALQIILAAQTSGACSIWFELDVIKNCSDLPVLVEKGLTRAEKYSMYPAIVNEIIDGSKETRYKSFIRNANIRTDVLTSQQMKDYLSWCLDNNRLVDYTIDGISEYGISLIPLPDQEFSLYDDFKLTPFLEVSFAEGIARVSFPN